MVRLWFVYGSFQLAKELLRILTDLQAYPFVLKGVLHIAGPFI
jgi:hypothetical protein